jgi:poly [ADP-ribose] polymerase 1
MFSQWLTIYCYVLLFLYRVDDVENLESLRWEDQQKIRKYIESGGGSSGTPKSNAGSKSNAASKSSAGKNVEYGIEVSQTSRAGCKHCGQKIIKGEVGF